jgi:hypothetical protein
LSVAKTGYPGDPKEEGRSDRDRGRVRQRDGRDHRRREQHGRHDKGILPEPGLDAGHDERAGYGARPDAAEQDSVKARSSAELATGHDR